MTDVCTLFVQECLVPSDYSVQSGRKLVIDVYTHVYISLPTTCCSTCAAVIVVPEADMNIFPATPSNPRAFYTVQFLEMALHVLEGTQVSVSGLSSSLDGVHRRNTNSGATDFALWGNLGNALDAYKLMRWKIEARWCQRL